MLGWVERLGRYADVQMHPSAKVTPGVLVYRLDDRLFFANVNYVQSRIREAVAGAPTPVHWLVFDAEGLGHVDATGIDLLTDLIEAIRKESITFVFARLKGPVTEHLTGRGRPRPRGGGPHLPDRQCGRRRRSRAGLTRSGYAWSAANTW